MRRHYVIVGGSHGLGRAFAAGIAAEGHVASVISRSRCDIPNVATYECDLASGSVDSVLETACQEGGAIDAVACFHRFRGAGDDWEGELQTSLSGTRALVEASVPRFNPQGLRSVVLVSSVNAFFVSPSLPAGYHVAKAGLCQLARYYACTLGPLGIRVNAVCPGTFIKPESERYYAEQPAAVSRLAALSPLGRMGTHHDVNGVVNFLLGDGAAFVTGQALVVDGGVSLRWPENS